MNGGLRPNPPMRSLEPDVRVIAPLANWKAETQLRINSGVEILKQARWNEVAETFRIHRAAMSSAAANPYTTATRPPGRNPRSGSASFQAVRNLGGVYRPRDDWRQLTHAEHEQIHGITEGADLATTIQVIEAPAELLEAARRAATPHINAGKYEFDEGLMDIGAEHLDEVIELMDRWLERAHFSHSGWLMVNIRAGLPGRALSSGFQSLHIDLYGPTVLGQTEGGYCGSRVMINLTDQTRHVAFVNLRLATMLSLHPHLLESAHLKDAASSVMNEAGAQGLLAAAFFESHPDYPVIRLTIEPGQGYIAPTPTLPHEGVLTANQQQDLILLASHKGYDGRTWRAPDYVSAWQSACVAAAHASTSAT